MSENLIKNKYDTIEEGIEILKNKWSAYWNSSGGFFGACLFYDCEELAFTLLKDGVNKNIIKEIFPPYFDD